MGAAVSVPMAMVVRRVVDAAVVPTALVGALCAAVGVDCARAPAILTIIIMSTRGMRCRLLVLASCVLGPRAPGRHIRILVFGRAHAELENSEPRDGYQGDLRRNQEIKAIIFLIIHKSSENNGVIVVM
jgi:hypothetical protein